MLDGDYLSYGTAHRYGSKFSRCSWTGLPWLRGAGHHETTAAIAKSDCPGACNLSSFHTACSPSVIPPFHA